MANKDIRRGLSPVRHLMGLDYNAGIIPCYVASTYGTALFLGDPVNFTSTANAAKIGKYKIGTLQEVEKATAGATNVISGVIVGFDKPASGSDDLNNIYSLASTEDVVFVCVDPYVVFEIQADSANPVAVTDIGANANVVYTHAGETVFGQSGAELDTSSMTQDATYQLTILKVVDREKNDIGTNVKLEVMINLHRYKAAVVGI